MKQHLPSSKLVDQKKQLSYPQKIDTNEQLSSPNKDFLQVPKYFKNMKKSNSMRSCFQEAKKANDACDEMEIPIGFEHRGGRRSIIVEQGSFLVRQLPRCILNTYYS